MRQLLIGDERFTKVYAMDQPGMGGACHEYSVETKNGDLVTQVQLQKGPVKETKPNGCFNEDLICIVIDRLEGFQSDNFACTENSMALIKLKEALKWLDKRTRDRQARGVEGKFEE